MSVIKFHTVFGARQVTPLVLILLLIPSISMSENIGESSDNSLFFTPPPSPGEVGRQTGRNASSLTPPSLTLLARGRETLAHTSLSTSPSENTPKAGESLETLPLEDMEEKPRDLKPLVTFGVSVGVQAICVAITTAVTASMFDFSELSLELGWGTMLAVSPMIDSGLGWIIGKRSKYYTAPFPAMAVGAYVGGIMAFALTYINLQKDNPKVDGLYDPIYFGRNRQAKNTWNIMTFGFASILLPAAGAALGHWIMRKPLKRSTKVSFAPPMPTLFSRVHRTKRKGVNVGVSLVNMRF